MMLLFPTLQPEWPVSAHELPLCGIPSGGAEQFEDLWLVANKDLRDWPNSRQIRRQLGRFPGIHASSRLIKKE
jgi:hypothetical protein